MSVKTIGFKVVTVVCDTRDCGAEASFRGKTERLAKAVARDEGWEFRRGGSASCPKCCGRTDFFKVGDDVFYWPKSDDVKANIHWPAKIVKVMKKKLMVIVRAPGGDETMTVNQSRCALQNELDLGASGQPQA